MTNVLTGAERFIAQWRQSTAEGNLYSPDDLTTYILGLGVVPGNGRQVSTLAAYLLNNAALNVKDFGAKGDGVTDDTATIHAARTAGGANGKVYFPAGTYLHSGLTASLAGQQWLLDPGATLKLKSTGNTAGITVSANDVTVTGGGTIDGNASAQGASSDSLSYCGVKAVGVSRVKVDGIRLTNCKDPGIVLDTVAGVTITGNRIDGNALAGNVSQIYMSAAGSSTDVAIRGNTIDGTVSANGGIKFAISAAVSLKRFVVADNIILPGDGASSYDTLGVELFCSTGGAIESGTISGNTIVGPNSTNTRIFGISLGGVATVSNTTGCRAIAVTGNTIRHCRSYALEGIGNDFAFTGNVLEDSGPISVVADQVTGDIKGVVVSGNSTANCANSSYAIRIEATANTIEGLIVANNSITTPAGVGIALYTKDTGTITRTRIAGNILTGCASWGIILGVLPAGSNGTLTKTTVENNFVDLTGAAAGTDGILVSANNASRITLRGNHIQSTPRDGIFLNVSISILRVVDNHIQNVGRAGIKSVFGGSEWRIRRNEIDTCAGEGIGLFPAPTTFEVEDNVITSPATYGIEIQPGGSNTITRFSVRRNTIVTPGQVGIGLLGTGTASITNGDVSQNRMVGLVTYGITIDGGPVTDTVVDRNVMDLSSAVGSLDGIIINNTSVTRVVLSRNTITASPRHGIFANVAVSDIDIFDNFVRNCAGDGIRTTGGSSFRIVRNKVTGCTGTGIILASSPTNVELTGNRCTGNTAGQINKGTATFTVARGNQSTTDVSSGRAVMVAGTVTVSTTEVVASDNIQLTRVVTGGTAGHLSVGTITAGTSFVINSSSGTDTSTVFWEIAH